MNCINRSTIIYSLCVSLLQRLKYDEPYISEEVIIWCNLFTPFCSIHCSLCANWCPYTFLMRFWCLCHILTPFIKRLTEPPKQIKDREIYFPMLSWIVASGLDIRSYYVLKYTNYTHIVDGKMLPIAILKPYEKAIVLWGTHSLGDGPRSKYHQRW